MEDNIGGGDHHPPSSSSSLADTILDHQHPAEDQAVNLPTPLPDDDDDNQYLGSFQVSWQGLNAGLRQSLGELSSYASNPRDLVSIRLHWLEIHDGDRQNQLLGALHVTWQGITNGQQLHQAALNLNYEDMVTGQNQFYGVLIIANPLQSHLIGAIHINFESTVSGDLRYLGAIILRWRGIWNDGRGCLSFDLQRRNPVVDINQIVRGAIPFPWRGINISLDRRLFELYLQRMNNEANQFLRDLGSTYRHYKHVGFLLLYSRGINAGHDEIFGGVSTLIPGNILHSSVPSHILWRYGNPPRQATSSMDEPSSCIEENLNMGPLD